MKKIINMAVVAGMIFLVSCGANATNETTSALTEKKKKLEQLKQQQAQLTTDIQKLENEIGKSDTANAKKEKEKLVAVATLAQGSFTHYIDLQGRIDALNVVIVAPRNGTGGLVKELYIKNGDEVRKGQILLKLDDAVLKRQLDQAQTQLAYAEDLYARRDNLWKQNIGTQVDLINAKNAVDQAQKQINIIKQQIDLTNVTADIDGVVDQVNVRVGEVFTGVVPGTSTPQIRIVNMQNLKAVAQVPENYLGNVKVGTKVKVVFPELNNKTLIVKVTVAGKMIDPNTRSFYIEAKIPSDKNFHPNQIALIKIQDYAAANVISVPVNTVQNDEKGKYVLVAAKEGDHLVARKRAVQIGQLYDDKVEITSGLEAGGVIITDGFQGLYDGQAIKVSQ
jgi:membrane fusion protein (multidrug efflux system)